VIQSSLRDELLMAEEVRLAAGASALAYNGAGFILSAFE